MSNKKMLRAVPYFLTALIGLLFSGNAAAGAVEGEALFRVKCIMCHGESGSGGYAHHDIKYKQEHHITNAIASRADMNFLSYLTMAQKYDLEAYLATVPQLPKPSVVGDINLGRTQFQQSCTYCHTMGRGSRVGPDLMGISTTRSDTWLGAWIDFPVQMVNAGAVPTSGFPYVMPDLNHNFESVVNLVAFMVDQDKLGVPLPDSAPKTLTQPEFDATKQVYFDRCAGCHGLYRTGATGPNIGQARAQQIGTDGLGAILRYGTPKGMPNFGQSGILTEQQIANLAAYLQLPPPEAPPLSFQEIQASWNLIVPVANRPTSPQTTRNWQNYVGVILRDAGQVSIIDGDTKEEVARVNTGFAVHILRSSATGRYFYSVGRDGLVTLIDLWTTTPTTVAKVKGCHDARSVDGSKLQGYEDTFVIEGCYWPPQYVVYDGLTLQPLASNPVPLTDITGAAILENRVAAIASSHAKPIWAMGLKESGYVGIVDYSLPGFPMTATLATEKFLHDGGFDHTGRYFMIAANSSNKMVVVDVNTPAYVGSFFTGTRPHPGRGANWQDPVYGWVNATQHIGDPKISVYGADPVGRPDVAWRVVREIPMPSAGSLFIKTHPSSPWVLFDMGLSSDPTHQRQVCAISKQTATVDRCMTLAANGKAVHMEFSMDGSEVWVSDWATAGGIIVLDAVTLAEKQRIYGPQTPSGQFVSPTGKFNVYNTAHDIY